jgi:hypothetical protein
MPIAGLQIGPDHLDLALRRDDQFRCIELHQKPLSIYCQVPLTADFYEMPKLILSEADASILSALD